MGVCVSVDIVIVVCASGIVIVRVAIATVAVTVGDDMVIVVGGVITVIAVIVNVLYEGRQRHLLTELSMLVLQAHYLLGSCSKMFAYSRRLCRVPAVPCFVGGPT